MVFRFIYVTVVAVLFISFISPASADDKENANMASMKRFYAEVINQGNIELFDDLCAVNFVEHEETPGFTPDREGVKKWFRVMRTAFPDLKFEVEFMFAKDDKVVTYITMTGTQKGPIMDMPASGKKMRVKAIDIVRFAPNGKAVEHWGVTDSGTMMQQLGAVPEKTAMK